MKVELVDIKTLESDPTNARSHSQTNIDAIAGSLREFGQQKPVVVWQNIVIAGNGTLAAATSLGWKQIAIQRVPNDWDHDRARAYALADNRTGELAQWDQKILSEQLLELDAVGFEVSDFGFTPLAPPPDPYVEWEGMPDFEQDNKKAAFKTSIHFATEKDANDFFEMIDRSKKASMWWPEDDGHIGSSVHARYIVDE